jgi:hypothetical protein
MKGVRLFLCAAGLLLAFSSMLTAGELFQALQFSPSEVILTPVDGYQRVTIPDAVVTGEVGGPEIPCLPVRMVIPPSATVEKVEVTEVREEILPGSYDIVPVQPGRPFSVPAGPFVGPDPVVYRFLAQLPGHYAEVSGTGTKCGYRIAGAMVYPLQYLPAKKQLILATRLVLKVTYREGTVAVEPNTPEQNLTFGNDVRDLVSNPGDVSRFVPPERPAGLLGSTFLPPGSFPHVIISTTANTGSFLGLRDTLAKLQFWRNRSGVRCTIMTQEDIATLYTGRDTAERVRNFIKDARTTWGTQMVFIASKDVAPAPNKRETNWRRAYVFFSGYPADRLPADLYFSDLDGSWDGDHDNIFGETTDSINGYSDIYVGRITLDSTIEASKYLRRLFQYEKTPGANYYQKAFLTNDVTFSNAYNDSIRDMTPTPPWKDCRMYASGGDVPISGAAFRDSLNHGWMYTAHIGHGDIHTMGSLYNCANALAQSNTGKPEVIIAVCCFPGAYDSTNSSVLNGDCLAENMITHAVDGWAAVMLNSRYGWVSCAESYNIRFFESLLPPPKNHYLRVGQCLGKAKDFFIPLWANGTWGTRHQWECYEKNLHGDPGMPLWNNPPTAMTVSHPLNIGQGSQSFAVNVSADQFAVDSAYVCLWKGAEVYATGYTNTSGVATFTINPTTNGTMYVTVTKRDRLPYEGNTAVSSGVEAGEPLGLPLVFELGAVSPNPLAVRGIIRYSLPRETQVSLKVYDASGRCVGTLVNGREAAGWKQVGWDARSLGSGVYFYRLEAGGQTATHKLVIVR